MFPLGKALKLWITGQKIIALVEATAPICVERFTDHPQLGRFTLRDEGPEFCPSIIDYTHEIVFSGKTVAIGKVRHGIQILAANLLI